MTFLSFKYTVDDTQTNTILQKYFFFLRSLIKMISLNWIPSKIIKSEAC